MKHLWKQEECIQVVGRKARRRRPLGRPRRRWLDNIKMDLGEIGWCAVDWTGLAQNRDKCRALVNEVMILGFCKMLGGSRVTTQLVASRVALGSTELLNIIQLILCTYVCL
jgi:hypothetical protein